MTDLPLEQLKALLGPVAQSSLTEKLVIVSLVMYSVRGHFKGLGDKIESLSKALISLEEKSSERMELFERRLHKLENKGE